MATVTLKPTKVPELIFEGYSITPDAFAGKTAAQIAALPGHEGKVHVTIGDFFTVSGDAGATAADTDIVIAGDAAAWNTRPQDDRRNGHRHLQCRHVCRRLDERR